MARSWAAWLFAAALLSAAPRGAQAVWGVTASVTNRCSKGIYVDFNDGRGEKYLSPGSTSSVTLCSGGCTGFLGTSKTHYWSYYATLAEYNACYFGGNFEEWVDGSVSIGGFNPGGVSDSADVYCPNYRECSPPPRPSSPPPPPSPPPPSPPIYIAPGTSERVSFSLVVTGVTKEEFEALSDPFAAIIAALAGVPEKQVDVDVELLSNLRGSRRRLLQGSLQVTVSIKTSNAQAVESNLNGSKEQLCTRIEALNANIVADCESLQILRGAAAAQVGDDSSSSSTGLIAGAVVAGAAAAALVAGLAVFLVQRRKRLRAGAGAAGAGAEQGAKGAAAPGDGLRDFTRPSPPRAPQPARLDPLLSWVSTAYEAAPRGAASPPAALAAWELPFDAFAIERPIGEGSFGRVYLARLRGEDVALKVLLDVKGGGLADPAAASKALSAGSPLMGKLAAEAALMAQLEHPNIVRFVGACTAPPAIAVEYCARGSLCDILRGALESPAAAAALPWRRRLAMAADAAAGMLYLHRREPPFVHRDLKSPNLLVDAEWRVKVADFGLGKVLEDDAARNSSLLAMNPRWLAPETFDDVRPGKAADVFAFGVVLWELATFEVPWGNKSPWAIVNLLRNGARLELPPPEALGAEFGGAPRYCALVRRCWAHNPLDRPGFDEVLAELREMAAAAGGEAAAEAPAEAAAAGGAPADEP